MGARRGDEERHLGPSCLPESRAEEGRPRCVVFRASGPHTPTNPDRPAGQTPCVLRRRGRGVRDFTEPSFRAPAGVSRRRSLGRDATTRPAARAAEAPKVAVRSALGVWSGHRAGREPDRSAGPRTVPRRLMTNSQGPRERGRKTGSGDLRVRTGDGSGPGLSEETSECGRRKPPDLKSHPLPPMTVPFLGSPSLGPWNRGSQGRSGGQTYFKWEL